MPFIYLHKAFTLEENRVDPNEIRKIEEIQLETSNGSLVTFKDNDCIKYIETPAKIKCKEWQTNYLWPNIERVIMVIIGGIIGGLLTMLFNVHPNH
jgi:hypothetical protein